MSRTPILLWATLVVVVGIVIPSGQDLVADEGLRVRIMAANTTVTTRRDTAPMLCGWLSPTSSTQTTPVIRRHLLLIALALAGALSRTARS